VRSDVEFLVGLLNHDDPAYVAAEDFDDTHGAALRHWQKIGFVSREPSPNPIPSCPHCEEGVPYAINGRFFCPFCHCPVDARDLLVWRLDVEAFLRWVVQQLGLRGGLRRAGDDLWQLGAGAVEGELFECFFCRSGNISESGSARIAAHRNVLVFVCATAVPAVPGIPARLISLVDLLDMEDRLTVRNLVLLLKPRGRVRFEVHSGALWVGDSWFGDVPVVTKEFFFLDMLAKNLDHFVAYPDLKRYVIRQTGSRDMMEEATFCHNLKNRIKKKWIKKIDLLVATTNKAEGYRLRGRLES